MIIDSIPLHNCVAHWNGWMFDWMSECLNVERCGDEEMTCMCDENNEIIHSHLISIVQNIYHFNALQAGVKVNASFSSMASRKPSLASRLSARVSERDPSQRVTGWLKPLRCVISSWYRCSIEHYIPLLLFPRIIALLQHKINITTLSSQFTVRISLRAQWRRMFCRLKTVRVEISLSALRSSLSIFGHGWREGTVLSVPLSRLSCFTSFNHFLPFCVSWVCLLSDKNV